MTQVYKAAISYDTDNQHPDVVNAKNLHFDDTYTIDTDYFYDNEAIVDYIKRDLSLVAGGGYDTKHLKNVKYDIRLA